MSIEHIVVDGSNIATEGRSLPSLKQLEEAVAELRRDHPDAEITVIVDATFAHRIDPSELPRFEEAALRGEFVHPPAGAIGRGDAFLLRVAEKVDGTVLSNDSFQEFHGEHPWLFERGRLLGGTPVPGIGWIFSPRQPVRGPRSRQAVRETTQAKKRVTKAIAVATKEVVEPAGQVESTRPAAGGSRRRSGTRAGATGEAPGKSRQGSKPTPLAVNDPLAFISFIAEHRLGERLEGEVESYTSHGAVVRVGDMRCYIPLANLGDPAPRSAREVLKRHEHGVFVLTALDPQRRGAELALPGIARVSGHPLEETVAAEVRLASGQRRRRKVLAPVAEVSPPAIPAPIPAPARASAGNRRKAAIAAILNGGPAPEKSVTVKGQAGYAAASNEQVTKAGRKSPAAKSAAAKSPTTKAAAAKAPAAKAAPTKSPAAKAAAAKSPASKVTTTGTAGRKAPASKAAPANSAGKSAPKAAAAKAPPDKAVVEAPDATTTRGAKAAITRTRGAKVLAANAPAAKARASKSAASNRRQAPPEASEAAATATPSGRKSPRATLANKRR